MIPPPARRMMRPGGRVAAAVVVLAAVVSGCGRDEGGAAGGGEARAAAAERPVTARTASAVDVPLHLVSAEAWGDRPCVCEAAKMVNGWCPVCGKGYVAGTAITNADLFEAIDPHGHEFDANGLTCPSCRAALPVDGFCSKCGRGFVGGKLYATELTYALALGTHVRVEEITCPRCRANADKYGWCDEHGVGLVGNVMLSRRDAYERASREYERLLESIRISERCEYCGVASFMGARCLKCGIDWRRGGEAD